MLNYLSQHWWVFLLRGIAGIVFGIFAFAMPLLTLQTLILVFGAYALVDGIFSLFSAISGSRHGEDRWLIGLQGLFGIIVGLIAFFAPGITAIGLLVVIAAWSLMVGALQIVAAIKLRKEIKGEIWLGLSGLVMIVFAFFIMAQPGAGALAVIWVIGIDAIAFGILQIAFAFRVKRHAAAS